MTRKDDKYLMFRDFMFNELGITKDDIETWVKRSIDEYMDRHKTKDRIDKTIGEYVNAYIRSNVNRQDISDKISTKIYYDIKPKILKLFSVKEGVE